MKMICYNGIQHYVSLFFRLETFETIENDFAILLETNNFACVFIKSPWGIIRIKIGFANRNDAIKSKKSCYDFFYSLTKEKAEEYINEYVRQVTKELTKSIAKRTKSIEKMTKRIKSETELKKEEQKQLEEFVRYSQEKEK